MRRWCAILSLVIALLGACSRTPEVSDTGYVGTWSRGNDRITSVISIRQDGGRYRFRWERHAADGKSRVTCDWDGRCEEFVNDAKTSEYRFTTWTDPDGGQLVVRCDGVVLAPSERETFYVDMLELSEDGLTLIARTIERDGQTFEGEYRPKHEFRKIDDRVMDGR